MENRKKFSFDHGQTDGQTEHKYRCWAAPSQLKLWLPTQSFFWWLIHKVSVVIIFLNSNFPILLPCFWALSPNQHLSSWLLAAAAVWVSEVRAGVVPSVRSGSVVSGERERAKGSREQSSERAAQHRVAVTGFTWACLPSLSEPGTTLIFPLPPCACSNSRLRSHTAKNSNADRNNNRFKCLILNL